MSPHKAKRQPRRRGGRRWLIGAAVVGGLWVVGTLNPSEETLQRRADQTATAAVLVVVRNTTPTASPSLQPVTPATDVPTLAPSATTRPSDTPASQLSVMATSTPQPSATVTPSATITDTVAPLPSPTLDERVFADLTIYTTGESRLRSCPSTDCDVVDTVGSGIAFQSDYRVYGEDAFGRGESNWYHVQHNGRDAYICAGVVSLSRPATPVPVVQPPPVQRPAVSNPGGSNTTNVRPGNCATAVAMGLSAVEAARWSHLDRDNDGVACYGD